MGRERREKEGSEVFPHVRRAASHLLSFCTGCVQLRTGRDGADVSPGGGGPGALKHPPVTPTSQRRDQSPFLEGSL